MLSPPTSSSAIPSTLCRSRELWSSCNATSRTPLPMCAPTNLGWSGAAGYGSALTGSILQPEGDDCPHCDNIELHQPQRDLGQLDDGRGRGVVLAQAIALLHELAHLLDVGVELLDHGDAGCQRAHGVHFCCGLRRYPLNFRGCQLSHLLERLRLL